MRDWLKQHLEDESGETLVETLAGILVCSLAVVLLTVAVVSAVNINRMAETRSQDLQTQEVAAEEQTTESGTSTATFGGAAYDITYYGGSDLASYAMTVS